MQLIGFLAFVFVGFTVLNRFLEGAFLNSGDVSVLSNLTITREQSIFGYFTIPVPNTDFFFEGLPMLLNFKEYSFFDGNAQMFLYLLYTVTAVVAFLLFTVIIGMASNFLIKH